MAQEEMQQIHSQLRTAQDKYVYFLLAVAASAIALSVQITKTDTLSFSLIPLGLAVISWGSSFFFGCKNIQYVNAILFANYEYLKIKSGADQNVGSNPMAIEAASQGTMHAMSKKVDDANKKSKWQFRLLVLGGVLFVVWHLVEMAVRTACSA